jgi:alpha-N-arabinofuranosidase
MHYKMSARSFHLLRRGIAATSTACFLLAGPATVSAQIRQDAPNPAAVSITVGGPGPSATRIPSTLFGSFLEPIDNSINQGLSAELVVNGSLESGLWNYPNLSAMVADQPALAHSSDLGLPYPWLPLHSSAGNRYALHHTNAANSWQSLEIMGYPGARAGIMQRVYLPAQRTQTYVASLYVRHLSGSAAITLLIKKHQGEDILASGSVNAESNKWTKYSATLKLKPGALQPLEASDFALSVDPDERIEVDEISLEPADAINGLDPDVVRMAQEMHSTEVRFGGNFSSQYDWREGTGPLDKRITEQNTAWGIPEYNRFGTDEFLRFVKLLHATPQIDLNMGTGTPEQAAAWVSYIHSHYPGKVIYELGNELYGNWQIGHIPVDQIAERTLAFSRAVRAVDPNAELIATGGMPQEFDRWNTAQLTDPPGTYNLLSTHFIRNTNQVGLPDATPEFKAAAAYALPVALGRFFQSMQTQLDAVPALRGKVHFAMDEWLFNSRAKGPGRVFTNDSPSWKNEGGGIIVAGVFNTLVRESNIVPVAEMTGLIDFAGIWKEQGEVYATPSYYIFKLYTSIAGDNVLPVMDNSGSYDVRGGVADVASIDKVPYVDTIATESPDGSRLTLFLVNRSMSDMPVKLDLGDFDPAASAQIEQMSSASRYDSNDAEHPRKVVPRPSTLQVGASGPVQVTLPRESVTMVRFLHR